ncbi:MAG: NAD(P)/FAD-dependent oxidoreductase [Vibrio sp.]
MKIAIIGSGISGLTCGYYLHRYHDITMFEANDYIGGHTATIDIELEGKSYAVDTGFIVYNQRTYPNFIKMMDEVGVHGKPTQMNFSVRNDINGLEYNGHTLATLFAQKRNWFNLRFYRFIAEILRFNRLTKACVAHRQLNEQTLGEFLAEHKFDDYFCENYILPMGAAIWSSSLSDMRAFPLLFFARFFLNHGLLDVTQRPPWYVIPGGSRNYIQPLTQGFIDRIHLNSAVKQVRRLATGVEIQVNDRVEFFDEVIFACHSNQALAMLSEPSMSEQQLLSALTYQTNEVVLHTDSALLPKCKAAWAAWNYWLKGEADQQTRLPALTYNMNILQHIQAPQTLCVTLNCSEDIDPNKVLARFSYDHPVFSHSAIKAQQKKSHISGVNHTWYCGAYWHNGFHEDGVRSALDVVTQLQAYAQRAEPGRRESPNVDI